MRVDDMVKLMLRYSGDATAHELALTTGLPYGSISATCTKLNRQGEIEWTKRKRRTINGRLAKVWRLRTQIG